MGSLIFERRGIQRGSDSFAGKLMDILEGIRELIATGKHDESAHEIFTFEYVLFWTRDKVLCTLRELATGIAV